MQIPETPSSPDELDLLRRLKAYAGGTASWNGEPLGRALQEACGLLHAQLLHAVNSIFAFLLDRVTSREMDVFTLHDRVHGRKVAHLMWHIIQPSRRETLTPPEIALLVLAAHLHDMGMGLSNEERASRLRPDSDLWTKLDIDAGLRERIDRIRARVADATIPEFARKGAFRELVQPSLPI
jgi:hypothetical protein